MENKETSPSLPEELVMAHLEALRPLGVNMAKASSITTIDYMGRFAEWIEKEGYWDNLDGEGEGAWDSPVLRGEYITTAELLQIYFKSHQNGK